MILKVKDIDTDLDADSCFALEHMYTNTCERIE